MPICPCCGDNVTNYQLRKHRSNRRDQLAAALVARDAPRDDDNDDEMPVDDLDEDMALDDPPALFGDDPALGIPEPDPAPARPPPRRPNIDLDALIAMEDENVVPEAAELEEPDNDLFNLPAHVPRPAPGAFRNPPVTIEDWDSEEEPDEFEVPHDDDDDDAASADNNDHDPEFHEHEGQLGLDPDGEPEMDDEGLWAYLREHLGDFALDEYADVFDRNLTDRDRKTLKFLSARLRSHFSRPTYDDLRLHACEEIGLPSDFVAWRRLKILSGLESRVYDCCINSCVCFLGKYRNDVRCRVCLEPRFNDNEKPRRSFTYTPLIPQLTGLFQNAGIVTAMRHRAEHEEYRRDNPDSISDVFDGEIYQTLRRTSLTPDYRYFDNPDDIALGLSTDGFNMYKRRRRKGNSTAWPLILVNYNLHASVRTRLENIICVGVIPGPKECKDINSFLIPLVEELQQLADGVDAIKVAIGVEVLEREIIRFTLRAFLIIIFGDIPAISKLLMLKGTNAITPCRACLIHGTPHVLRTTTYYVPLTPPPDDDDDEVDVELPEDLIMRTHDEFLYYYDLLSRTEAPGERRAIAQEAGIAGKPVLARLGSLDLASCAPYEMMHLIFENLVPNMISHWRGTFFKDALGDEPYHIDDAAWKLIGERTAAATKTIPAQFVGTLPNIEKDLGLYKAEGYSFWFTYLAPVLLNGVLDGEYYEHFLAMREIIIWLLEFDISHAQLDDLEIKIRDWVQEYERLYYRYEHDRLPACLHTVHALLHIPYYIRRTGPLTCTWSFVMERFCGYLLRPAMLNRVRPYEFLDNYIRRRAQMQIVARVHDIPTLLRPNSRLILRAGEYISSKEVIYEAYRGYVFGQPVNRGYQADDELKRKFTRYFGLAEEGGRRAVTYQQIHDKIDWTTLVRYGRVRMTGMGDRIRAARLIEKTPIARDNSFIRYELLPDANYRWRNVRDRAQRVMHYGRVKDFFYVEYKQNQPVEVRKPYILALVRECNTGGRDATEPENPLVTYNVLDPAHIISLGAVLAAVGRVKVGGRNTWAIIDRTNGAHIQFNDDNGIPDRDLNPDLF